MILISYGSDSYVPALTLFSTRELLEQILHLLRSQDIEVNLCCIHVLRAVASEKMTGALDLCSGLGLYEILDDIQVQYSTSDAVELTIQSACLYCIA